jgi:hypothetical protein
MNESDVKRTQPYISMNITLPGRKLFAGAAIIRQLFEVLLKKTCTNVIKLSK